MIQSEYYIAVCCYYGLACYVSSVYSRYRTLKNLNEETQLGPGQIVPVGSQGALKIIFTKIHPCM